MIRIVTNLIQIRWYSLTQYIKFYKAYTSHKPTLRDQTAEMTNFTPLEMATSHVFKNSIARNTN